MRKEDLQPASYRGVSFLVVGTSTTGGRKTVTKEFISSGDQLVEDLGLKQRGFTISAIVAATRSSGKPGDLGPVGGEVKSYQENRDDLLDALEKGGPGILIHPFFGKIDDVVCLTYNLNETMDRLGEATVEITFAISNTDGLPEKETIVLNEVFEELDDVTVQVGSSIDDLFAVSAKFIGNFEDGVAQVSDLVDAVNDATSVVAKLEDQVDSFSLEISDFEENVASLVATPTDLSDSIVGLWETMNGLYPTAIGTYEAFTRLFDFGDDDVSIIQNTSSRIERKRNRDAINSAVQALSLAYAYANAAQVDFQSVEEIDEISEQLEDQYQKMISSGNVSSDVEESLTRLRLVTTTFFNAQRVTKPQVIQVRTNFTSTRLLAYRYYGSSELGETIAKLNGIRDAVPFTGVVKILTA